jgi:hypothetical protein
MRGPGLFRCEAAGLARNLGQAKRKVQWSPLPGGRRDTALTFWTPWLIMEWWLAASMR